MNNLIKFFKTQMSAYASCGIKLEKQLKEARAEAESYKNEHQQMRDAVETFMDSCLKKDAQIAGSRAEYREKERDFVTTLKIQQDEIERKDKLIEQMRGVLKIVYGRLQRTTLVDLNAIVEDALSATERGE